MKQFLRENKKLVTLALCILVVGLYYGSTHILRWQEAQDAIDFNVTLLFVLGLVGGVMVLMNLATKDRTAYVSIKEHKRVQEGLEAEKDVLEGEKKALTKALAKEMADRAEDNTKFDKLRVLIGKVAEQSTPVDLDQSEILLNEVIRQDEANEKSFREDFSTDRKTKKKTRREYYSELAFHVKSGDDRYSKLAVQKDLAGQRANDLESEIPRLGASITTLRGQVTTLQNDLNAERITTSELIIENRRLQIELAITDGTADGELAKLKGREESREKSDEQLEKLLGLVAGRPKTNNQGGNNQGNNNQGGGNNNRRERGNNPAPTPEPAEAGA